MHRLFCDSVFSTCQRLERLIGCRIFLPAQNGLNGLAYNRPVIFKIRYQLFFVQNKERLVSDLKNNWAVVSEAIQTILRREEYPAPYEALKTLTRGKNGITKQSMHAFIDGLNIAAVVKKELKNISPHNYTGIKLR